MEITTLYQNYCKILGLNARNLDYILKKNQGRSVSLVNNKLKTKRILKAAKIPVPENYFIIKNKRSFALFSWDLPKSFVLKPNRSLGGQGVLIVYGKKRNSPIWIKTGQRPISIEEIKHHVFNILEGNFSHEATNDIAFFEERIKLHPSFKPYTFKGGIPDIRVLVYDKVPIMAELRLPTRASEGRSNLHLGGIGVGIDMKTGVTTTAIQNSHFIDTIPKTRLVLSGIKIPFWKKILQTASLTQETLKINFLGIDIAVDREKGPMVLEANAHPGIAIQLANQAPLRERLQRVEGLKIRSSARAIRLAQELFGGEIEEELEEISGRKIIGIFEPVKILLTKGESVELMAKIDTGAYRTSIDKEIAKKLKIKKTGRRVKKFISSLGAEERELVDLEFNLAGQNIKTKVSLADRLLLKHDIIIGRRDLREFLIDPLRKKQPSISKGI